MMKESTPGCFSMFRRRQANPTPACDKEQHVAKATAAESNPATATPPPAHPARAPPRAAPAAGTLSANHEHYDPCGCGDIPLHLPHPAASDEGLPAYVSDEGSYPDSAKIRDTIRAEIARHTEDLTRLSLWISDHPELGFNEHQAAAKIASYLEANGWSVEKNYCGLETAFKASFSNGAGRTFAFNSEYDALPGVGHACGHNLIAVAGLAAALGVRAAMQARDVKGSVVLIGTPAEEGGVGKAILLEGGGYKQIDGCMMIHPVGLPTGAGGLAAVTPTLAVQTINVAFRGRTAHAAGAPWDGINALDAAHVAYAAVSALRQQMRTSDRVHGIIVHGGEAPNIIPDYTSMRFYVRAESAKGVTELMRKVKDIFEAAGKATGCTVEYDVERLMYDLKNNLLLAEEFASAMTDTKLPTHIALKDFSLAGGSTDFGNVTYAMPACHPHYAVPSVPGRSNHTVEFRDACRTPEAHTYTFQFAAGMGCVAGRFLVDEKYAEEARRWWEDDMREV